MVHAVVSEDNIMTAKENTFVGFSTSPKGDFNIVKLWNNTTAVNSAKTYLNPRMLLTVTEDVVYTAHKSRK
jgi:hypothetical protein